jgi:predicted GNAT family N-acyltransferase
MLKVIPAITPQEKQKVYHFRYKVYVEEMRKQPRAANHQDKVLTDELDETATLLYIAQGDEIIATLQRSFLDSALLPPALHQQLGISQFVDFPKSALSVSTRLMVAPAYRNSTTAGAIILAAYQDARERGVQFDFLHAAPWLIPFYTNLGYRRYTSHFLDPDVGLQVPQVLVTEDVEHLRHVRSPFYRKACRYTNNPAAADWFKQTFPQQQSNFLQNSIAAMPVFQGLSEADLQQLLQASAAYNVRSGETVIRIGDVINAMYIVLTGMIEIRHLTHQSYVSSSKLSEGQTFGEANLFHQTLSAEQAVALADSTLLILPKPAIAKLMKIMPEAMCHLLFAASQSLCVRYVPDALSSLEVA